MEFFIKKMFEGEDISKNKKYFLRFGKGSYKRRFVMALNKGAKIKIKASYELSNSFVEFVRENKEVGFSGKILTTEKVQGKEGRKKAGSFVYEISESNLEGFENPYFYLLDANSGDIVLKIKKSLPKPGKDEEKVDDKFCSMELDEKYWGKIKESFFWDIPDKVKKVSVEHEILISDIEYPEGEKDPVRIRELAKRKGKMIRKLVVDGKVEIREKSLVI